MSSDIPMPTPDPHVEDTWFQRPAFLATCALIVVLVGTVVWFLGREENGSSASAVPTALTTGSGSSDSTTSGSGPGTSESTVATSSTMPLNPFGDLVGSAVVDPQSAAGRYALVVQLHGDPATVAALHSPAYYYGLWSRLLAGNDLTVPATASAAGYSVQAAGTPVELIDLGPAIGPISDGAETRVGVTTPFEVGIQSTGVCLPDREPQCDLSGPNFAPDSLGSGAQMWALAKVVTDPEADTWLLYVDLKGPRLAAAEADGTISVAFDAALNIAAVTYAKEQPPGTVLTLRTTADDGSTASFDFAVS